MKNTLLVPLLSGFLALSACGDVGDAVSGDGSGVAESFASVLGDTDSLDTVRSAMDESGLSTMFDSPGASYTVLAPEDAAFDTGEGGEVPPTPILAALLREHIVPGHLDRDAIAAAIEQNGGPVKIATVGDGTIEFSQEGDSIVATHSESGQSARMTGSGGQAENGALFVIDELLVPLPAPEADG